MNSSSAALRPIASKTNSSEIFALLTGSPGPAEMPSGWPTARCGCRARARARASCNSGEAERMALGDASRADAPNAEPPDERVGSDVRDLELQRAY